MKFARWLLPTLLPATLVPAGLALWSAAADETREPPARFELRLGEARVDVESGAPFEIEVDGKTLRGELVPRPTRRLSIDGLAFDYPEGMTFEFERFLGVEIWTLDGNDLVVMVNRYGSPVSVEEATGFAASGLAESFGEPEQGSTSIGLGAREVRGLTLTVDGGSFVIHSELFLVDGDAEGQGRHVVMLQDIRDDADEPSEEFARARELLGETFASGERR